MYLKVFKGKIHFKRIPRAEIILFLVEYSNRITRVLFKSLSAIVPEHICLIKIYPLRVRPVVGTKRVSKMCVGYTTETPNAVRNNSPTTRRYLGQNEFCTRLKLSTILKPQEIIVRRDI